MKVDQSSIGIEEERNGLHRMRRKFWGVKNMFSLLIVVICHGHVYVPKLVKWYTLNNYGLFCDNHTSINLKFLNDRYYL